jgi:hypothetical protein
MYVCFKIEKIEFGRIGASWSPCPRVEYRLRISGAHFYSHSLANFYFMWGNSRHKFARPGTDVMILKIFSPEKKFKNILRFFVQNTVTVFQKFDHNIGF